LGRAANGPLFPVAGSVSPKRPLTGVLMANKAPQKSSTKKVGKTLKEKRVAKTEKKEKKTGL
jgi:hypothetical protein